MKIQFVLSCRLDLWEYSLQKSLVKIQGHQNQESLGFLSLGIQYGLQKSLALLLDLLYRLIRLLLAQLLDAKMHLDQLFPVQVRMSL